MSRKNKRQANNQGLARYRNMPNVRITDTTEAYNLTNVLQEFVEPFIPEDATDDDLQTTYLLAMISWNMALAPAHERIRMLMPLLQPLSDGQRLPFRESIAEMIQYKESDFAEYRQSIADIKLVVEEDCYHLTVLWDLTEEEEGQAMPSEEE